MDCPTAVQAVAEEHATDARLLCIAPVRLRVAWIDQLVPFHRSASVNCALEVFTSFPTAAHTVAEEHDTPRRSPFTTEGVASMDQLVPFHRSASACMLLAAVACPTAVQAVADVHETPLRALTEAPAGLGVAWMDQLVPFQDSASVAWVPVLPVESPTAVQAVADVHETPSRSMAVAPARFGVA